MQEIIYEAYGPGGSALVIKALTDNINRTAMTIKTILGKHG
ncbi:MAG: YebC/PmpR family DNA-binding transcriptional regulator [bacterium]|nr:YebC/PmpR family DNA-binding transcriptional regulator [bacterium]